MLYIFHKMPEWVSDEQLLASYADTQDLIMEITRFFFYGVLPHELKGDER